MNEKDIDNGRLQSLLKITAQRLGSTPQELQQAARNGTLSKLLGNAAQGDSAAMQKVLSDPDAAKKLLATPQAQKLLQMLQGGEK